MARSSDVSAALATLQARWGSAAPRRGGDLLEHAIEGALARVAIPVEAPDDEPARIPTVAPRRQPTEALDADGRVVPTGFAALDAVLGIGGAPPAAAAAPPGPPPPGGGTPRGGGGAPGQAGGGSVAGVGVPPPVRPPGAAGR